MVAREIETYPVHGSTIAELRASVIDQSRMLGAGAHGAASATFRFEPELSYVQAIAGCVLGSITVRLTATMVLPEWVSSRGADEATVAAWRRFLNYVRAHEERHAVIAAEYRAHMETELEAIGVMPDCQAVGREAVAVVAEIERQHDEAQQQFDRAERDRSSLLGR
ncbi:DUF922 domain-containing protein [Aureimonas sp. SK2]|uniref:DUF922 domain-containing protein n=1 Tax=Aureimonas sp. SK2 TaxID=3015992 RepID=UPI0024452C5A|nr:DUF922 domain-containing protein [Aureimonas sp. SK2]